MTVIYEDSDEENVPLSKRKLTRMLQAYVCNDRQIGCVD